MRKKYIFFIFFIIINLPSILSQNTIGTLINSNDAYDGYTLFTVSKSTYLINNCGQVINEWISDNNPGFVVYLLPDGSLLRAELINDFDPIIPGKGGLVVIRDWNNDITWEYTFSDANSAQHHDVFPLPNGNILVLIVERKTMNEAILAGRNPANLIDGELFNEKIIEVKPIGSNGIEIVWEWNAWDHLIQDFDNTKNNFGDVLNNPQLLDINYLGFSNSKANWLHVNSIQYNSSLDQIVLSSRQLNEFYIIDHSTTTQEAASNSGGLRGKGGDFLYRWGNPLAYKAGMVTDQKLFGQHYPHWIPSGLTDGDKILIFNNGFNRNIEFSSVDIVNPPQTQPGDYVIPFGEKIGPVDFDWTYVDPIDPINFFSKIMASAQRLPNGNTLICEGTKGNFFEIDSNKNIVWNYLIPISPSGILSQGDPPDPSRVFRAFKYSKDDVAFDGKNITPGDPIELNFDLSGCTTLSVDESVASTFTIFPNPVNDKLNIRSSSIIDKVEVFNIQGVLVSKSLNQNFIQVKNLTSGIYLLKVYSENGIVNKKIIVY